MDCTYCSKQWTISKCTQHMLTIMTCAQFCGEGLTLSTMKICAKIEHEKNPVKLLLHKKVT